MQREWVFFEVHSEIDVGRRSQCQVTVPHTGRGTDKKVAQDNITRWRARIIDF
jgi:hypothetical protein